MVVRFGTNGIDARPRSVVKIGRLAKAFISLSEQTVGPMMAELFMHDPAQSGMVPDDCANEVNGRVRTPI